MKTIFRIGLPIIILWLAFYIGIEKLRILQDNIGWGTLYHWYDIPYIFTSATVFVFSCFLYIND